MDKKYAAVIMAIVAAAALIVLLSAPYASAKIASGPLPGPSPATSSATGCGLLTPSIAQNINASAPWYCPINTQVYNAWKGDLPIAIIVVLIAMLIAASIFAVGTGLKNDRLRNFGIGEMYEAVASMIIVGIFLYVSAVMFGLLPSMIIGPINPYATSLYLITNTIGSAESVYTAMYDTYYFWFYISSIDVNVVVPALPISGAIIGPVAKAVQLPLDILVVEPIATISSFVNDGILALYAEYYLIVFFAVAAIPAFLIPGIVLRMLIPTRALGGMMIALAMGFYLIMPTLFSVAYYFTAPSVTSALYGASAQLQRFAASPSNFQTTISASSPEVTAIQEVQSSMSSFWLLILFYPSLIVAVTYAFVVQIADLIGGASRMGGRMRGFI
jgi:hypothetical protein